MSLTKAKANAASLTVVARIFPLLPLTGLLKSSLQAFLMVEIFLANFLTLANLAASEVVAYFKLYPDFCFPSLS